jgi:hypothetical protein
MTTLRLCIACCITKATNTHSQYAIFVAFPQQQCLQERALIVSYTNIAYLVWWHNNPTCVLASSLLIFLYNCVQYWTLCFNRQQINEFYFFASQGGKFEKTKIYVVPFKSFTCGISKASCSTQLRGCPRSYVRSSHFVATAKIVVTLSLETPRSGGGKSWCWSEQRLTSRSQGAHRKSCANCLDLIQVEWISYSLLTVLLQIPALEVFIE